MTISATSSFSSAASLNTNSSSGTQQRPNKEEALASALQTIGVDEETAASVLAQVQVAVDAVKSDSSQSDSNSRGGRGSSAVRSAIASVLEENGIDPAEVGDAIRDSQSTSGTEQTSGAQQAGGPRGGGRPNGPPPPRSSREGEDETGSVESALLAANVGESDVDELLTQLIATISDLTSDEDASVSAEDLRTALTDVLDENGVDIDLFESALQDEIGSSGSFLNRIA